MTPFDVSPLRSSKPGCPSDFKLSRLSAGELSGDELTSTRQHIDDCQDCGARLATMSRGFDAFPEANPQKMLAAIRREGAARAERGSWMKWLRLLVAPVAVAGVATVIVMHRPVSETAVDTGTRMKGTAVLHVFKQSSGGREVTSGEHFKAGDRLAFQIDLHADKRVQVIGIDAHGQSYRVWPSSDSAVEMSAGARQPIPGAVELDDARGTETLYAVVCPPDVEAPSCVARGAAVAPSCKTGCVTSPFVMQKDP